MDIRAIPRSFHVTMPLNVAAEVTRLNVCETRKPSLVTSSATWLHQVRLYVHGLATWHGRPAHVRRLRCAHVRIAVCVGVAALSILSPKLVAEIQIGNGVLTFDNTVSATYTTNVEGRNHGGDAQYITLAPRLIYERPASLIRTRATAGLQLERYLSTPRRDSNNVSAGVSMGVGKGVWGNISADVRADYTEASQTDYNVNARVLTNTTTLSAKGEASLGRITTLSLDNTYTRTEAEAFPSADSFSTGGELQFALWQTAGLFTGYRHLETRTSRTATVPLRLNQSSDNFSGGLSKTFVSGIKTRAGFSYTDLRRSSRETRNGSPGVSSTNFFVNVDGPFLPPRLFPKLTSSFSLAYGRPETLGLNDYGSSQLTGALSLAWAARPTTRLHSSVSRSRNLTIDSLSSETTSTQFGIDQTFTSQLVLTSSAGYEWITLRGIDRRKTEAILGTFQASKPLGTKGRWSATLLYNYRNSSSSAAIADFVQHTVVGSLGYKY